MRQMGFLFFFGFIVISISVSSDTIRPTVTKSLTWLYNDEEIADRAKFPMYASDYGIDVNAANVSQPNVAGYFQGRVRVDGYTWKMLPTNYMMSGFGMKLASRTPPREIFSIYILEKKAHGWAHWVRAEFVGVGPAPNLVTAFGFADNQVITLSEYLGFDTYRVYSVKGVSVPR